MIVIYSMHVNIDHLAVTIIMQETIYCAFFQKQLDYNYNTHYYSIIQGGILHV